MVQYTVSYVIYNVKKFAPFVVLLLAVGGFIDSLLVHQKIIAGEGSCGLQLDCERVIFSQYNHLFGISLSWWGMAFYGVLVLATLGYIAGLRWIKELIIWLVAIGFFFSLYFLYLQVIVLSALCLYCLISFLIVTVIGYIVFVFRGFK